MTLNLNRRLAPAGVMAGLLLAASAAGCGAGSHATGKSATATTSGTPAAFTSPSANPVAEPPLADAALTRGSSQRQIAETIVAFYRAAWEDDATEACDLFSPAGAAGFMHAASMSFPQSVNKLSTCEHAMEIYNAALGESASTAQDNDDSFNPSALDNVGVAEITVDGDSATAIAPTNVVDLINPEQIVLQRVDGRWLISASHSLNKSNLPAILARAKAKGELTPTRDRKHR